MSALAYQHALGLSTHCVLPNGRVKRKRERSYEQIRDNNYNDKGSEASLLQLLKAYLVCIRALGYFLFLSPTEYQILGESTKSSSEPIFCLLGVFMEAAASVFLPNPASDRCHMRFKHAYILLLFGLFN